MSSPIIELSKELFAPGSAASYSGAYALDALASGPDVYVFADPISWRVQVTNTGDAFLLQGSASGVGTTSCARCLEPATFVLEGELSGYYLIDGDVPREDLEEEDFFVLADDHRIDLEPLIGPALLLDMPMVPLCRDDCKGLCPSCGANLNEGDCGCALAAEEEALARSPFAALKDMRLND